MKTLSGIISLGVLFAPFCVIGEPSQRAQEFVAILNFEKFQDGGGTLPVEGWDQISKRKMEDFEKEAYYTVDLLEEEIARWVDKEFTEEELDTILNFLQSESGKVFIKLFFRDEGRLDKEVQEIAEKWSLGRVREMHAFIQSKELEK